MKHLLRHGVNNPTSSDLDERQIGISTSNAKLWTKLNGEVVCLNDYATVPLEEEEVRSIRFEGAGNGAYLIEDIYNVEEEVRIQVSHSRAALSRLLVSGDVQVMTLDGPQPSLLPDSTIAINLIDDTFVEYVISRPGAFSLKISAMQQTATSVLTIENLVFSSESSVSL